MANLGHGHGPFHPQGFFIPAVSPPDMVGGDENEGSSWFVDLQIATAAAITATVLATTAIAAQSIGNQSEEIPHAIASPGVQQLVISPTQLASQRLRHFYASEELPPAPVAVFEDGGWIVQLPPVVAPVAGSFVGVEDAPIAPAPTMIDEDHWWKHSAVVIPPTANQPQQGIEERPSSVTSSGSVQQVSPTGKEAYRLRHFYAPEEISQTGVTPPNEDGWLPPILQPWSPPVQPFVEPEINVPTPLASPGTQIIISPTGKPPSVVRHFYAAEEWIPNQTLRDDHETWIPPRPNDLEPLIPVPWFGSWETELGSQPIVETEWIPGQIPAVFPPVQAFWTDEDRVVPPPAINFDDVPQPTYDRQIAVQFPPKVFTTDEERPPSITFDDIPRGDYDRQVIVAPPPFVFRSAEELPITPTFVGEDGILPLVPKPLGQVCGAFTSTEEIFPHTSGTAYLDGSTIAMHNMKLKMVWRWTVKMSKTAAGTVGPVFQVKLGPNGNVSDTTLLTFPLPVGTADADDAEVQIVVTVRGPLGGACIAQGFLSVLHNLASTGFATIPGVVIKDVSTGFNSAPNNLKAGVAVFFTVPMVLTFEQVVSETIKP